MQLHREYRKDWRTDAQFARDIKDGHAAEREIIRLFGKVLERETGKKPTIVENGDTSGEIFSEDKVDTKADFIVNGVETEVKFINPRSREFRFKVSQLYSYLRQKAFVLFVNGWQTPYAEFVVLTPASLREIKIKHQPKPFHTWGNKLCYFLSADEFQWTPLRP